jgi:hypothetical protein
MPFEAFSAELVSAFYSPWRQGIVDAQPFAENNECNE